jgi:hypothetical protein
MALAGPGLVTLMSDQGEATVDEKTSMPAAAANRYREDKERGGIRRMAFMAALDGVLSRLYQNQREGGMVLSPGQTDRVDDRG